jgi:hypothetical protein
LSSNPCRYWQTQSLLNRLQQQQKITQTAAEVSENLHVSGARCLGAFTLPVPPPLTPTRKCKTTQFAPAADASSARAFKEIAVHSSSSATPQRRKLGIQVTKMHILIIDHWYLQSHNSGNPLLFSKRQSNTYHVSNMTMPKQLSLARVYNITSMCGQAQMYLMHLTCKQQSICYNSASHNLQKKCLEIDKWPLEKQ